MKKFSGCGCLLFYARVILWRFLITVNIIYCFSSNSYSAALRTRNSFRLWNDVSIYLWNNHHISTSHFSGCDISPGTDRELDINWDSSWELSTGLSLSFKPLQLSNWVGDCNSPQRQGMTNTRYIGRRITVGSHWQNECSDTDAHSKHLKLMVKYLLWGPIITYKNLYASKSSPCS